MAYKRLACMVLAAVMLCGCTTKNTGSLTDIGDETPHDPERDPVTEYAAVYNIGVVGGDIRPGNLFFLTDCGNAAAANVCDVRRFPDADAVYAGLADGSLDMAFLPILTAAAHSDTLMIAAVTSLGAYRVVCATDTVVLPDDLREKTICLPEDDEPSSLLLNDFLTSNGIDRQDITLVTKKNPSECLSAVLAAPSDTLAVVRESTLITEKAVESGIRTAFDITSAWEEAKGVSFIDEVFVISRDFLSSHPDTAGEICGRLKATSLTQDSAVRLIELLHIDAESAMVLASSGRYSVTDGEDMRDGVTAFLNAMQMGAYFDPSAFYGITPPDDEAVTANAEAES